MGEARWIRVEYSIYFYICWVYIRLPAFLIFHFSSPQAVNIQKMRSKRWEMMIMIFSGISILYFLRVNVSVAAEKMKATFGWTEKQKGLVLVRLHWRSFY